VKFVVLAVDVVQRLVRFLILITTRFESAKLVVCVGWDGVLTFVVPR
jgi:hypothetical protein